MKTPTASAKKVAGRKSRPVVFKPIDSPRPADAIQIQIRKLVASHRLRPGDRLPTERELAEQFVLSRNTVRQAIRSLADSGLLEVKKGAAGGAFIRNGAGTGVRTGLIDLYSIGSIQPVHLTEMRLLISVEVVRLACQRGTDEQLAELERNVELAEAAAAAGDVVRRTTINLEFYRILARMSQNPLLETVTDAVMAITLRFVEDFLRTSTSTVMPFRRAILADLYCRDCEAAAERMRGHLLQLQTHYLNEVEARRRESGKSK